MSASYTASSFLGPDRLVPSGPDGQSELRLHPATSRPQDAHQQQRAGSRGGDSRAAGAEMLPAGVSPSPEATRAPSPGRRVRSARPLPARSPGGAPHPFAPHPLVLWGPLSPGFLPSPLPSPPPHNRPRRPAAPHPAPPLPNSWDSSSPGCLLTLTCHVLDPTAEGGASRPRGGRGQHFRADKGRRHVGVGRNRPRWLPVCNFRRMRSGRPSRSSWTGACAYCNTVLLHLELFAL